MESQLWGQIKGLVMAGKALDPYGADPEILAALRNETRSVMKACTEASEGAGFLEILTFVHRVFEQILDEKCIYYEGISYLLQLFDILLEAGVQPELIQESVERAELIMRIIRQEQQQNQNTTQTEQAYLDRVFKEVTFFEFSTLDAENQELYDGFCEESQDLLEHYEQKLVEASAQPNSLDVNDLFRILHTIKGTASFMHLCAIQHTSHAAENLLSHLREKPSRMTPAVYQLLLEHLDLLKGLFENLRLRIKQSADGTPRFPQVLMLGPLLSAIQQVLTGAEPVTSAPIPAAAPVEPSGPSAAPTESKDDSIRIPVHQLEEVYNLIGELTVLINNLRESQAQTRNGDQSGRLTRVTSDLRALVAGMFMLPVSGLKTKLQRLCLDVARKCNKSVRFEMTGEDIELHKNTLELLHNLLIHMLRNSIDHGIEDKETRSQQGKKEQGLVRLNAAVKLDKLEFSVEDDGRGLDPQKIRSKALKLGWLKESEEVSDEALYPLILKPGFSLAEQVTDISGRGVGMDVVSSTAHQMGGELEIHNRPGKGLLYRILLPMSNSTSIITGLVGLLGDHYFIFPIFAVSQTFSPTAGQESLLQRSEGLFLRVRQNIIPIVPMDKILGIPERPHLGEPVYFLIEHRGRPFAVCVDQLVSQQQVVVEALDDQVRHLPGIDSCALLGNGRMGLIVDPSKIIDCYLNDQFGSIARNPAAPLEVA